MDEGCVAHFTKNKSIDLKNNKSILQGHQNIKDGLYNVKFEIHADKDSQNKKIKTMNNKNSI